MHAAQRALHVAKQRVTGATAKPPVVGANGSGGTAKLIFHLHLPLLNLHVNFKGLTTKSGRTFG